MANNNDDVTMKMGLDTSDVDKDLAKLKQKISKAALNTQKILSSQKGIKLVDFEQMKKDETKFLAKYEKDGKIISKKFQYKGETGRVPTSKGMYSFNQPILTDLKQYGKSVKIPQNVQKQIEASLPKASQSIIPSVYRGMGTLKSDTMQVYSNSMKYLQSMEGLRASGAPIIKINYDKEGQKYVKFVQKFTDGSKTITRTFTDIGNESNRFLRVIDETGEKIDKRLDFGKIARYITYFKIITRALGVLTNQITGVVKESIDFNETIEKFNVSMGEDAVKSATRFQNKLAEAVGTSRVQMMDFQSNFKNILAGLGTMTDELSEKTSESLTKMSLDYASLFNVTEDVASKKFQSALTGNIRAIREQSGFDVSKAAVAQKANELGVDKVYTELNETEKRILRIILLMEQMKNTSAFNDLARTIESPANQLKVLQNQLQELRVWLGNVFMGTIGAILPYINGFVMALKELIKMFAIFVGYTPIGSTMTEPLEEAAEAADEISSGVGGASKKAKELKNTLQGFDVLNVIQTPAETGGGGGGSTPTGIDPKILAALSEYDSLMEKVKMKATDIRDKIMDWLGFTKKLNLETGEIEWFKKDGYTNFEKILDIVQQVGKGLLGWKISKSILNFFEKMEWIKNVNTAKMAFGIGLSITGITAEYNGVKHLLKGDVDLFTILEAIGGGAAGAFGISQILMATKFGKTIGFGRSLVIGLGITLGISSIQVMLDGISKDSISEKIIGVLGTAGSGAAIGAAITKSWTGAIVGAFAGMAIAGVSAMIDAFNKKSELVLKIESTKNAVDEETKSWNELKNKIQENLNVGLAQEEYNKKLVDELGQITESNGEVKAGYEDRVQFILTKLNSAYNTSYKLADGQITRNGKEKTSYDELKSSIDKMISSKKAELLLDANKEIYTEALKDRTKSYIELKNAAEEQTQAEKEVNNMLSKYGVTLEDITSSQSAFEGFFKSLSMAEMIEVSNRIGLYEETNKIVEGATNNWKNKVDTITDYENLQTSVITGKEEEIQKAIENTTNTYEVEGQKVKSTIADNLGEQIQLYKLYYKGRAEGDERYSEEYKRNLDNNYNATLKSLKDTTSAVEELTPEQVEAWTILSKSDSKVFTDEISNMPVETAKNILKSITVTDENKAAFGIAMQNLASKGNEEFNEVYKNLPDDIKKYLEKGEFNIKSSSIPEEASNLALKATQEANATLEQNKIELSKFFALGDIGGVVGAAVRKVKEEWQSKSQGMNLQVISGSQSVSLHANGGFPETGEMFVAREAGPELVGRIGSRTAVANNDQIVQAVSNGVANAVASVLGNQGGSYNLYIDGEQITDVVQKRMNRNSMIYGV